MSVVPGDTLRTVIALASMLGMSLFKAVFSAELGTTNELPLFRSAAGTAWSAEAQAKNKRSNSSTTLIFLVGRLKIFGFINSFVDKDRKQKAGFVSFSFPQQRTAPRKPGIPSVRFEPNRTDCYRRSVSLKFETPHQTVRKKDKEREQRDRENLDTIFPPTKHR